MSELTAVERRKLRQLSILGIVFVILLGITVWIYRTPPASVNPEKTRNLLRELASLSETEAMRVVFEKTFGDTYVELKRKEGKWVLPEAHNYLARKDQVEDFFKKWKELEKGILITDRKDSFRKYDVADTFSRRVSIETASGKKEVIVGRSGRDANSNYIRIAGTDFVFLVPVNLQLYVDKSTLQWYEMQITDFSPEEVSQYKIMEKGKEVFVAERGDTDWKVVRNDIQADTSKVQRAVEVLSILRAVNVKFDDEIDPQEVFKETKKIIFIRGGLEQWVEVGKVEGGSRYLRCSFQPGVNFLVSNYNVDRLLLK